MSAGAVAAGVVTLLVGDGESPAESTLPTTTVATTDLITVVPVPAPDPCSTDPESLAVWTAGVRIDEASGAADAVIRFENLTSATCELDLTDPSVGVQGAESSVRLEPDGWGELLIGGSGAQCAPLSPLRSVVLELNHEERTVLTSAAIACERTVLAFLPAERPIDPCVARALTTAVVAAGLVVRNDGSQPCVIGDLLSISIPTGLAPSVTEMAQTRPGTAIDGPVGPPVTALARGDVAFVQTFDDPIVDCAMSVQPARLHFAEVEVDGEFPICSFVRLGPAHAYYGSPRGPLADAAFGDEFTPSRETWIAALDPFRPS